MPFVTAAQEFLTDPKELTGDKHLPEMKATVEFMLENAVGRENAISSNGIVTTLKDSGYEIRNKEDWQILVLGKLRKNGIFIGSKRGKGMFIIKDRDDAKVVISQIETRIREEEERLSELKGLVEKAGWEI